MEFEKLFKAKSERADSVINLTVTGEKKPKVGKETRNELRWTASIAGSQRLSKVTRAIISFRFPFEKLTIIEHWPQVNKPESKTKVIVSIPPQIEYTIFSRDYLVVAENTTMQDTIHLGWEFRTTRLNPAYCGSIQGSIIIGYFDSCKDKPITFDGSLEVDMMGGYPFRRTHRSFYCDGISDAITPM